LGSGWVGRLGYSTPEKGISSIERFPFPLRFVHGMGLDDDVDHREGFDDDEEEEKKKKKKKEEGKGCSSSNDCEPEAASEPKESSHLARCEKLRRAVREADVPPPDHRPQITAGV